MTSRTPSQRVGAVLVDNGGVLTLPNPDVVHSALSSVGLRPQTSTLDRAHYVAVAAYDRAGGGQAGEKAYLTAYARAAGVPPAAPPRQMDEALSKLWNLIRGAENAWSRVRPGAVSALQAICHTGVRVVIVSNAYGRVEQDLLALGICQVGPGSGVPVAAVVDSAVVGVAKPDPRIFEIALARAGVPATSAVHVGDSVLSDVEGARASGIRALHLDPYRLCKAADHDPSEPAARLTKWYDHAPNAQRTVRDCPDTLPREPASSLSRGTAQKGLRTPAPPRTVG